MEETTYIKRCGERVPADACTMVADTILCPDCVDTYTTVCDCCGERLVPVGRPWRREHHSVRALL